MMSLDLFNLEQLINHVKPKRMFPEDQVNRRITILAVKYDKMAEEEEEGIVENN